MKITVGVPAHNAQLRIAECLDCLLAQTGVDLQIMVSQNGSTDDTAQICDEYAAKHANITVHHHDPVITMTENFRFLLDQATTPLFHWRADDDLSNPGFLSILHDLLDQDKSKKLAGGAVRIVHTETGKLHNRCVYPTEEYPDPAQRILEFFVNKHNFNACDWFYGLWDNAYLRQVVERTWDGYGSNALWGSDALTALPAIMEGCFACSPEAEFHKRLIGRQRLFVKPKSSANRLKRRFELYGKCRQAYLDEVERAEIPQSHKADLAQCATAFARRTMNIDLLKQARWQMHKVLGQ